MTLLQFVQLHFRDAIATVKTENAEASKKVDKARIDYFICKEGRYTYSMLDDTLKDLTNVPWLDVVSQLC